MSLKISEKAPYRAENVYKDDGQFIRRFTVLLKNREDIPEEETMTEGMSHDASLWEEAVTTIGKSYVDRWIMDNDSIDDETYNAFQKTIFGSYNPSTEKGKVLEITDKDGFQIRITRQGNRGKMEFHYPSPEMIIPVDSPIYYFLRRFDEFGMIDIHDIETQLIEIH